MENDMTNQQMKTILKMIEQIVKACDTKEEAEKKIEDLLKDYD